MEKNQLRLVKVIAIHPIENHTLLVDLALVAEKKVNVAKNMAAPTHFVA